MAKPGDTGDSMFGEEDDCGGVNKYCRIVWNERVTESRFLSSLDTAAYRKLDVGYWRQATCMFRWLVLLEHSPELASRVTWARGYIQRIETHLTYLAAERVDSGNTSI